MTVSVFSLVWPRGILYGRARYRIKGAGLVADEAPGHLITVAEYRVNTELDRIALLSSSPFPEIW